MHFHHIGGEFMKIRPYLFIAALQIFSWSLTAEESPSLRTYLPSYRMSRFFDTDLSGRTPWYSMQPFSGNRGTVDGESFPSGYSYDSGEMIMGKFDQIYYFSALMDETADSLLTLENHDHLKFLRKIKILYGNEIILCISGNSGDFIPLLRDGDKRNAILRELASAVQEYGLSGIDLDWEFPRNDQEKEFFVSFLGDLRQLCTAGECQLSIAASRFRALPEEAYSMADYINLMTYDFYGRHSTVESTKEALEYMMVRYGIPPGKLLMGIPFYGRIFDGYSPDYWKKSQSYRELLKLGITDGKENEIEGYFFNGSEAVQEKIRLGQSLLLGGFFIWEIGQDSFGSRSLTLSMIRSLYQGPH